MISRTAIIHENVTLGKNCIVEDFVIIGAIPKGKSAGELKTVIGDNAVIRSHTVIYAGNTIGSNFQTGNKVNIRESNEIRDNVSIGTLSVIEHHIKILDDVRIHSQAFIPEYSKLMKGSWIGPNVVLTNARYPNRADTKEKLEGPTIEENAVVGANSTILPGVLVGEGAIVGAGAVVT
ncbi:MAG: transferase, partial [Deltaproteobacteria bacterium]|nr:transferase [Deltaproteobacteria bacterium]